MSDYQTLPDELAPTVEAMARAMNLEAGRQRGLAFKDDWDSLTEQDRGGWRLCAHAALQAALSSGHLVQVKDVVEALKQEGLRGDQKFADAGMLGAADLVEQRFGLREGKP